MSSIPADEGGRPGPVEPGWQACTGLTLHEAEQLLDQLEAGGVECREVYLEAGGVTVRWRSPWPRLAQ